MNLSAAITHHALIRPHHPALVEGSGTLTYAMLECEVDTTARQLAEVRIQAGDRVGICLKEGSEFLIALFAVARLWAVVVPMDWRAPEPERRRIAEALGLQLLICEPGAAGSIKCAIAWPALRSMPAGSVPLREVHGLNGDAAFLIALTSGTTGRPKGLVVSHQGQLLRNLRTRIDLGCGPEMRYLLSTPLAHAAGRNKCIGCLISGNTVIIRPPLFRAEELVEAAARYEVTDLYAVPATARLLLRLDARAGMLFPRLHRLVLGAGPVSTEDRAAALRQMSPNTYLSFGASGFSTIALLRPEEVAAHPGSVGRPTFLTEVQMVDESSQPVPAGCEGRLRCRGPGIASEIIGGDPDAEETEFLRDGWYYTGDIGRFSEGSFIHLTGRVANRIRRGGASIAAEEVERVLCEHPSVAEAAVIGRPSLELGQDVIAFVIPRGEVLAKELEAHCRRNLARVKVPTEFNIVHSFPRNAAGRIMRRALLESVTPKEAIARNPLDEYR